MQKALNAAITASEQEDGQITAVQPGEQQLQRKQKEKGDRKADSRGIFPFGVDDIAVVLDFHIHPSSPGWTPVRIASYLPYNEYIENALEKQAFSAFVVGERAGQGFQATILAGGRRIRITMAMGWLGKVRKGAPSAEPKRALAGLPCSMADKGGSLSGRLFSAAWFPSAFPGSCHLFLGRGIPRINENPPPGRLRSGRGREYNIKIFSRYT